MLETVTSADGTTIAFEQPGDGPAVVLAGGAFSYRTTAAGLAGAAGATAPTATRTPYSARSTTSPS